MNIDEFDSLKRYVGFDAESAANLRAFREQATPAYEDIARDFYDAIQAHPVARAVIRGGPEQVERLKTTLVRWLDSALAGPHDAAYLERRARIGRVHVEIELPQQFMLTAMSRIRWRLLEVVAAHFESDVSRHQLLCRAINQLLDLELAVILDSFREDLLSKMRARERLATMGQLSATIAHELRTPLGTVESSLYLLYRRLEKLGIEDPVLSKHHERIARQVEVCGATISGLLDLTRSRVARLERVQAVALIESAVTAARLPPGIEVSVDLASDTILHVDPDQMRRVMVNLLLNATEAMGQEGSINIHFESSEGAVEIHVTDTGPGVPTELHKRVFDVLYTTKFRGTGLGLALCQQIMEAHQGAISLVPSTRGAHFRIWLPRLPIAD